ncbi:serine kinase [Dyella dinghuensis]|uniref:Serine kinase n=1 Tax=Dyella dinghuensis TaxID=1920169 RepID=A0A432LTF2_9GAMM|nr:serine kinase [Dyella dinghuensis]
MESIRQSVPEYEDHADLVADPFFERLGTTRCLSKQILGGRFFFSSQNDALLDLVETTYGGLPGYVLSGDPSEFHVELRLVPRAHRATRTPPLVQMQSGAGLLCGVMDASNYVVLMPAQRKALIVASEDMLIEPYHLRYELIEFAVFALATRGMGLVPLHGACVGRDGRGLLLLGASGSGKSTLALNSLLHGLDFLAEDAVFVQSDDLLATGVPNYLHVRADALPLIEEEYVRRWICSAPVIRRRSGVEKFEIDLRTSLGRLAEAPMILKGAVFLSAQPVDGSNASLKRLPSDKAVARLDADQPYAAGQPGWQAFTRQLVETGVYELRRGRHPQASVDALLPLLA